MSTDLPPLRAVYGTGTGSHEHIPDPDLMRRIGESEATDIGERTYAAYLAVSLIGQRTPEEIIVLADYLRTGDTSTISR